MLRAHAAARHRSGRDNNSFALPAEFAGTVNPQHCAGLLVLSQNYYPGWKAWLDEAPAVIYRSDIAFPGVASTA